MKVTLFNQYFPPDTSATAAVFEDAVSALIEAGHDVEVVAGRPSYDPRGGTPAALGVRVIRVWSSAFDRRRRLGRVVNYVTYLLAALIVGTFRTRPDVVLVGSDPPLAIAPAIVAARRRPVVYSLQDLHPHAAVSAGIVKPSRATLVWDQVHTSLMRRAARVVCLGASMERAVVDRGVEPGRVVVIPNGARNAERPSRRDVVEEIRGAAEFVAVYAGNLGSAGAWETLLAADRSLPDGAEMAFVGDGINAELFRSAGKRLLPLYPTEDLASVMAAGDLQIVTMKPGMEGGVVPSKLYSILMHGRPVLAVVPPEGEIAEIVRRHGCGLVADAEDSSDVAAKIAWAREHPHELGEMASRAAAAGALFDRAEAMRRLVSVVEDVSDEASEARWQK